MRAILLLFLLEATSSQVENPFQDNWDEDDEVPDSANNDCTVDQSSCRCCLMLQETERLKSNFNHSLEVLKQLSSQTNKIFNQITANRIAFSVALLSSNALNCFGPFGTIEPIIYKYVLLNMGNSYDPQTGIFTVPHSGVYSLAFTIYSEAGSLSSPLTICASLMVNNQVVVTSTDVNSEQDREDSTTNVVAIRLKDGDKVSVSLQQGCMICSMSHYNTFSAFLLYQE